MKFLAKFNWNMKGSLEKYFALLVKTEEMAPEIFWIKIRQGENHKVLNV